MSATKRTLQDEWRDYRDACYPQGMVAEQNQQLHQAFFAGCLVVLKAAVEGSAGMPADKAQEYIAGLVNEAQEVCRQRVYAGKARN